MVFEYAQEYIENVETLVEDCWDDDYSNVDKVSVYRRESILGDPGVEVVVESGDEKYSFENFYEDDELVESVYDEVVEEFGSLFDESMVFAVKADDGFRSVNLV